MAFLNFKTFILKYIYSNNFKTIFLTMKVKVIWYPSQKIGNYWKTLVIGIGTNNRIQWLNQEDLDPWTITPLHSSNSWYNACMQRKQSLVVNVRSLQKEKMRFICNFLSCFTHYLQLKILSLWLNLNWKRLSNGAELIKLIDATKENATGKM